MRRTIGQYDVGLETPNLRLYEYNANTLGLENLAGGTYKNLKLGGLNIGDGDFTTPDLDAITSVYCMGDSRLNARVTEYILQGLLQNTILANGLTGVVTEAGVIAAGTTTIHITSAGTFTITLPYGVTGTLTSGTATIASSPKSLVAGLNTCDSGATTGTATLVITSTVPPKYDVINRGVDGSTVTDMLTRMTTDVTNLNNVGIFIHWGFINSIGSGDAAAITNIETNLAAIYLAAKTAGAYVIACTETPMTGYSGWNAQKQTALETVNTWIATAANVDRVVDLYNGTWAGIPIMSPAATLNTLYDSGDHIHMNTLGYTAVGNILGSTAFTPATFISPISHGTITAANIIVPDKLQLGQFNTSVGMRSLYSLTTGYYNTAVGTRSMYSLTTGYGNVATGQSTMESITSGYRNSAFGYKTLSSITTGYLNVAMGYNTGYSMTVGNHNTMIGQLAAWQSTSMYQSTAIGSESLYSMTSSASGNNLAVAFYAMFAHTSGSNNTAVGAYALATETTAANCVALGYYAGGRKAAADATSELFIDAFDRTTRAHQDAQSLIWGKFAAYSATDVTAVASQELTFNAGKMGFFGHAANIQPLKASYNNWAALGDLVNALVSIGILDTA